MQGIAVVAAIDAIILTLLANAMRARGPALGLQLAVVLFGVQTFLSLIEAIVFGKDLRIAPAILYGGAAASLLRDALAGAAIAVLWRGRSEAGFEIKGLFWKAPVIAVFYIVCYFTAGASIAMQSAAVRAYYTHVGQFDMRVFAGVQFVRGLIWCAFAW